MAYRYAIEYVVRGEGEYITTDAVRICGVLEGKEYVSKTLLIDNLRRGIMSCNSTHSVFN